MFENLAHQRFWRPKSVCKLKLIDIIRMRSIKERQSNYFRMNAKTAFERIRESILFDEENSFNALH